LSLLLDTHVLVWAAEDPDKLGKTTRKLLLDPAQSILVSAISTLEIARLSALDKLRLSSPVGAWCERARRELGAESVPIDDAVAAEAYALPGEFHPDPSDRLLVATARLLGLKLVTADRRIVAYRGVRTQDAKK